MDFELGLSNGETVLGIVEGISFHTSSEGLAKLFDSSSKTGSLVLTNLRLLFCWEDGAFRKQQKTVDVALHKIRKNNHGLQILFGSPKTLGGPFNMTVYATDGQYVFDVPLLKRIPVEKMIATANSLFAGPKAEESRQPVDVRRSKSNVGKGVGEAISGAIGSAKPVIKDAADAAKPLVPLAAEVVSTAFPGVRAVSDALSRAAGDGRATQNDTYEVNGRQSADVASDDSNTDGNLSTLVKLKELLDSGILTQDEFDAKKRQLLGL